VRAAIALVLVAAALAVEAYVRNRRAIAFLSALGSEDEVPGAEFRPLRVPLEGLGPGATAEALYLPPEESGSPTMVVVAGLTAEGVRDPRVARLARAFRRAGFAVLLPEVEELRRPGEGAPDGAPAVRGALRLAAEGGLPKEADGSRIGLVGVSVGGPYALRAATSAPAGLRALFLVGVPDDVRALAREWFRRPVAPEGATGAAFARSEAGVFARHALLETALPHRVPAADAASLRAWLQAFGEDPARRGDADPVPGSDAGRRWMTAALAEADASAEDVDWVLDAASDALARLSPAAWDAELAGLRAPVFLAHGVEDPLVPVAELAPLTARLSRRVEVRALESAMLSHVGVASPGFAETWRHVRFVTAFFDAMR
jgi:pimeloyl-ACP methyl ester carboxylesterase